MPFLLAAGLIPASALSNEPVAEPPALVAPSGGGLSGLAPSGTGPGPAPASSSANPACKRPGHLGTSRIIAVNPALAPLHLGLKTYPQTIQLGDHELVLTFDDGPSPRTTPAVLNALHDECVEATFFLIGRNAAANPGLVQREDREFHTVGTHSNTHPSVTLRGLDAASGATEIEAGIRAVEKAGYGPAAFPPDHPHVPFFRFPGFADTPALLSLLDKHHIAVFGADLWASDWLDMSPDDERRLLLARLEAAAHHSGIVLLHDTKRSTAAMLPAFLRDLKQRGYHIVHLVPAPAGSTVPAPLAVAPKTWTSETARILAHVWPRIVPGAKQNLPVMSDGMPDIGEPAPKP